MKSMVRRYALSGILFSPTIAYSRCCDVTQGSPDDEFQGLMLVRRGVRSVRLHLHEHNYAMERQCHWHTAATVLEWSTLAHSVWHFVYQQQHIMRQCTSVTDRRTDRRTLTS